jgi:hypothetical protein
MPSILDAATSGRLNVIVRPYGPDVWFIQLDDLKADQLARLAPRIFLILETSPGNHQAWFALPGQHNRDFARRVRRGAGTDKRATGATRIAGSFNLKEKHDPAITGRKEFPRVAIHTARPGQTVTTAELEDLGLVAPPEEFAPFTPAPLSGRPSSRWPSYQIALDRAGLNRDGSGPDRSNADLKWCMTAMGLFGFGVRETAAQLMKESAKAQQRGQGYADMITETAARFVAERQQRIAGHEHR